MARVRAHTHTYTHTSAHTHTHTHTKNSATYFSSGVGVYAWKCALCYTSYRRQCISVIATVSCEVGNVTFRALMKAGTSPKGRRNSRQWRCYNCRCENGAMNKLMGYRTNIGLSERRALEVACFVTVNYSHTINCGKLNFQVVVTLEWNYANVCDINMPQMIFYTVFCGHKKSVWCMWACLT